MDDHDTLVRSNSSTSRAEVVARLRAHEGDIRQYFATALFLFGSAARDELQPQSDVDIFVDYDPGGPFSFVELVRLEVYLKALLGRDVDFTTRDGLHPKLKAEIERSSLKVF